MPRMGKSLETKNRLVNAGAEGRGGSGREAKGYRVFGVMRIFSNLWWWWLCKSMNIVKVIELYSLNGCALYMKSVLRKKKKGWRRQKQGDTWWKGPSHPLSSCSDDR